LKDFLFSPNGRGAVGKVGKCREGFLKATRIAAMNSWANPYLRPQGRDRTSIALLTQGFKPIGTKQAINPL
jgi:hypothetical protein